MSEEEVFKQKLSDEEFMAVSGGGRGHRAERTPISPPRNIYDGFPNCAATVEDGSWCDKNDACFDSDVVYLGMTSCSKAWK